MLNTKQSLLNAMYELIEKIEKDEIEVYTAKFTVNPEIIEQAWIEHAPVRQYTGRVDYILEINAIVK